MTSIQKLKAGLSAVIQENPKLIKRTKEFYFSNQIVFSDTEEEYEMRKDNKFYKFLEQNDRQMIINGEDYLGEVEQAIFQKKQAITNALKTKLGQSLRTMRESQQSNNTPQLTPVNMLNIQKKVQSNSCFSIEREEGSIIQSISASKNVDIKKQSSNESYQASSYDNQDKSDNDVPDAKKKKKKKRTKEEKKLRKEKKERKKQDKLEKQLQDQQNQTSRGMTPVDKQDVEVDIKVTEQDDISVDLPVQNVRMSQAALKQLNKGPKKEIDAVRANLNIGRQKMYRESRDSSNYRFDMDQPSGSLGLRESDRYKQSDSSPTRRRNYMNSNNSAGNGTITPQLPSYRRSRRQANNLHFSPEFSNI